MAIIAIDGPAGSGKSTVAKLLADRLGFTYIDTGAMYRAVTLAYLRSTSSADAPIDTEELAAILAGVKITLSAKQVFLNAEDVSAEIRSSEISNRVSDIAAIKSVRDKLVAEQRIMGESGNVLLDGRDIGTVVFPNADLKIFLVASPEIRAERRLKDLAAQGEKKDLTELIDEIKLRDKKDSERTESPLRKADDAIELVTDSLSVEQVVEKLFKLYSA